MYSIRFDPYRHVFYLSLTGFWTMTIVVQFAAEMLVRTTAARVRHRRFAILSDARDFPIQSAVVSQYFERIMARGIDMNVGPTAIVVASHLNKLQAERLFDLRRVRVFLDREEAERWLDSVWP